MCIFHKWSKWFNVKGRFTDTFAGVTLRETPMMNGQGRVCLRCGKQQFKPDKE